MTPKTEKGAALEESVAKQKRAVKSAITIKAPKLETIQLCIVGDTPYVQHKFSQKAMLQIMATQEAGRVASSKKVRTPKDFDKACEEATHYSRDGWIGIPAGAFRNAMISACRLIGFKMTLAKLAVTVKADGYDRDDGTPLVRIYGVNRRHDMPARNDNGKIDIRSRPMWEKWVAKVMVRFDADTFNQNDIANLMMRVGLQVGIGEGRNDSKNSAGIGWGSFELCDEAVFRAFTKKRRSA